MNWVLEHMGDPGEMYFHQRVRFNQCALRPFVDVFIRER